MRQELIETNRLDELIETSPLHYPSLSQLFKLLWSLPATSVRQELIETNRLDELIETSPLDCAEGVSTFPKFSVQ